MLIEEERMLGSRATLTIDPERYLKFDYLLDPGDNND